MGLHEEEELKKISPGERVKVRMSGSTRLGTVVSENGSGLTIRFLDGSTATVGPDEIIPFIPVRSITWDSRRLP